MEEFLFCCRGPCSQHNVPNARKLTGQTDAGMLALYTSRYMRAQASFFFHCRMCLRKLSAPLPCKSLLEPVCRSTCKADLSSHLGCSRLSQCCFLTCKLLACPRSMQVYRYSSQESTEQSKCEELQRRPQLASGLFTFVSVLLSDMQAFSMSTFHVHAGVQVQFTTIN